MRARKGKADIRKAAAKLPPPRPLYGLQAELYELLVVDLEATIEARVKALKRLDASTAALEAAAKREKRLRNQLATFAPALEGFEHDAAAAPSPTPAPPPPAADAVAAAA